MKRKRDKIGTTDDPSKETVHNIPSLSSQDEIIEQLLNRLTTTTPIMTQVLYQTSAFEIESTTSKSIEYSNYIRERVKVILELIEELVSELELIKTDQQIIDESVITVYTLRVDSVAEQAYQCQELLNQITNVENHEVEA
ncbi:16461_t:CDS:2 [Cetraspora pellucida]|uniref:16461_t:CDS:1 n=1 Tax=Cetraspora pellucida TaxID=1433469 RepID=A0A9N8VGK4_9GLOM|nr:16461_t:CDS:2 [Cetraspora pellucida]